MAISRRFLPSMSLLTAFEAVARSESTTLAAAELALTQSAVSRQLRALEEQIGVELFVRDKQKLRLTRTGKDYAEEIRDALQRISRASWNVSSNPAGGRINLAVLPTFGTRWLAPRLATFFSANPSVTLNLTTKLSHFDFSAEDFDAAIQVGMTDDVGVENLLLLSETLIAVCSPGLKQALDLRQAADLVSAPLLHVATRPQAWERWFGVKNISHRGTQGMYFDQIAMISEAAISGAGVALLPKFLVEDELAAGKLVPAVDGLVISEDGYYLSWPTERASHPALVAFRDWLQSEAARAEGHSGNPVAFDL